MDYGSVFEISATGMDFQRLRLEAVASNIANANTTKTNAGQLYKPLQAVAWRDVFESAYDLNGVVHQQLVAKEVPARRVYDPEHPHADAEGYVFYPNINILNEITELLTATRAYEANVSALNAAKAMTLKALEIGE